MTFERDESKALGNLEKHGVSFDEAASVFDDPLFLVFADPDHSLTESRFPIVGTSSERRVLIVSYTERGDSVRLISAREVTFAEKRFYEEGA